MKNVVYVGYSIRKGFHRIFLESFLSILSFSNYLVTGQRSMTLLRTHVSLWVLILTSRSVCLPEILYHFYTKNVNNYDIYCEMEYSTIQFNEHGSNTQILMI